MSRWRFPSLPFTAVCLPLRTRFQAGHVAGRSLWGMQGSAQEPKGFSPASPGALLYSGSASPVPAASRAVPRAGPDCRAQTLEEPCAVRVVPQALAPP